MRVTAVKFVNTNFRIIQETVDESDIVDPKLESSPQNMEYHYQS